MGNLLVDTDICETGWNGPQINSMDLWFNDNEGEIYANAGYWDGDYYDITMDAVLHDATAWRSGAIPWPLRATM
jgi:hypothetical protein